MTWSTQVVSQFSPSLSSLALLDPLLLFLRFTCFILWLLHQLLMRKMMKREEPQQKHCQRHTRLNKTTWQWICFKRVVLQASQGVKKASSSWLQVCDRHGFLFLSIFLITREAGCKKKDTLYGHAWRESKGIESHSWMWLSAWREKSFSWKDIIKRVSPITTRTSTRNITTTVVLLAVLLVVNLLLLC